jgi:hypothetical protein
MSCNVPVAVASDCPKTWIGSLKQEHGFDVVGADLTVEQGDMHDGVSVVEQNDNRPIVGYLMWLCFHDALDNNRRLESHGL